MTPDLYTLRADEAATRLEGQRWVRARRPRRVGSAPRDDRGPAKAPARWPAVCLIGAAAGLAALVAAFAAAVSGATPS